MQNIVTSKKISKNDWLIFAVVASATLLSFIALKAQAQNDGLLRVYFLNVGQGDAELIDINGNQILVDGGPDSSVLQELGKVMPFYDHSIDVLLLSHPHTDHLNGLIEVLKRYKVNKIIENYTPYNTAEYAQWNNDKTKAEVIEAQAGQIIDLGNGAKITILYPFDAEADNHKPLTNVHDAMVVFRLDYGAEGIIFTGDAEAKTEFKMISSSQNLRAQFLKVGHHGSKTSTSEEFLNTVNPIAAFIEVGRKNKYGHPTADILERLNNHDIKYYRTDTEGTMELILDGKNYSIQKI